jgi:hypothetical protein
MAHTATLTAAILVQDLSGSAPVTVAQNEKIDQVVDLEEFTSSVVVIPPNTDVSVSPVIVSFSPFQVETVFVKSSRPVTMRVGSAGADTLSVRSAYAETYVGGDGPDQLKFGNTDPVNSAVVTVVAGSNQP